MVGQQVSGWQEHWHHNPYFSKQGLKVRRLQQGNHNWVWEGMMK